jgi:beta-glucosidase
MLPALAGCFNLPRQPREQEPSIENVCSAPSAASTGFYGSAEFPSPECRQLADQLLANMTLREKLAQIVQVGNDQLSAADISRHAFGSVLSGGGRGPKDANNPEAWAQMVQEFRAASLKSRPRIPILYGIDAVHGHNNVHGAVIFPHNIGLGASRDPDLVERAARVTAEEVVATGIDWTFAPVLAAARDERWGRTYEAYGEAPELGELLGPAAIRGLQGARLGERPESVLACAKHFLGDGSTALGDDQGDADLDDSGVRQSLLPAYARAIEAGVGSIMVSYSSIRGIKMHCNGPLLTDVLKRELGFNGILVSDWEAIDRLPGSNDVKFTAALNAGVDMLMHPKAREGILTTLQELVPRQVSIHRIQDAVRRVLAIKCEQGLFRPGRFQPGPDGKLALDQQRLAGVGSAAHRQVAREAVQKSLVLLKNGGNTLPLPKDVRSLLVAGKSAHDLGNQCGGWSITWQGRSGAITSGTTILQGVQQSVSQGTRVVFDATGRAEKGLDAAIVVIGETPYAEYTGDRDNLSLDPVDVEAVENARAAAAKVVVVLVTGRPLILGAVLDIADAIVVAWLPGTEGNGVTDVLFGEAPPTGKLPHSWPKSMTQIPLNVGDPNYDPLFPYGFGLAYDQVSGSGSAQPASLGKHARNQH